MSFFHLRPIIRHNMAFIEECYRNDMRIPANESMSSEELFGLRRCAFEMVRQDLGAMPRIEGHVLH